MCTSSLVVRWSALALLAGCAAAPEEPAPRPVPGPPEPVNVPQADWGDPFAFLLARYDRDGDLEITSDEYMRLEGQLAAWDRDGDGRVTARDFEPEEGGIMATIGALRRERSIGRAFQTDEDDAVLTLEEFGTAFAEYDADGDLVLTEAEFAELAPGLARTLPGDGSLMMQGYARGAESWPALLQGFDADASGALAIEELGGFLESLPGGELRFDQDRCDGADPGATIELVDLDRGAPEGERAPELELTELGTGARRKLSEFAGVRPVALIFGSFT